MATLLVLNLEKSAMKWKESVMDYFNFSRQDRIAILILALLIILISLAPAFFSKQTGQASHTISDTTWIAAIQALSIKKEDSTSGSAAPSPFSSEPDKNDNKTPISGPLFYFDPNTLEASEWVKLGLSPRTIKTLKNYLAKGGHFYKPEDLSRIYGINGQIFERLEPYIRIIGSRRITGSSWKKDSTYPRYKKSPQSFTAFDINTADTTAFISLPGIGEKLASRIVHFREKLGGFFSIEQVAETYGLIDSVFQKIKRFLVCGPYPLKKLNINTATIDDLKTHPYLRYTLARALVTYREEHGSFSKIEDVKNVLPITDEIYKKLEPYFTTGN
ncbi:MAG TPA: helix-hairpin-helix domain-containing protein [Chryseolinea sp.]|nr:helix-hairpin-helix domain-containing protein [Chryseolinea sp.]